MQYRCHSSEIGGYLREGEMGLWKARIHKNGAIYKNVTDTYIKTNEAYVNSW